MLKAHTVSRLIDVRTVPRSRHKPHYNVDTLPVALASDGIGYEHVAGLGGFRKTHAGSLNTGWRNVSFRGYADYMQTPDFAEHLQALVARARSERIVLMCAEAMPWRCHRSLIADALVVHNLRVEEINSPSRRVIHMLTPFARVNGMVITYPPKQRRCLTQSEGDTAYPWLWVEHGPNAWGVQPRDDAFDERQVHPAHQLAMPAG